MKNRDVHEYSFQPLSYLGTELGAPYLVTVTRSDDPSEEPVATLPYPQAHEQYGDALWPAVVTCGACYAQYPDITPAGRCPFEYEHERLGLAEEDEAISPLYKTTIVIWSRFCGDKEELSSLAHQAEDGAAYCSRYGSVLVSQPATDPDWDGTDFFSVEGDGDEDKEEEAL